MKVGISDEICRQLELELLVRILEGLLREIYIKVPEWIS